MLLKIVSSNIPVEPYIMNYIFLLKVYVVTKMGRLHCLMHISQLSTTPLFMHQIAAQNEIFQNTHSEWEHSECVIEIKFNISLVAYVANVF